MSSTSSVSTLLSEGIFDNENYNRGYLYSVFLLQQVVITANYIYILCSLPNWVMNRHQVSRIFAYSLMLALGLVAGVLTTIEMIQLHRHRLLPRTLFGLEVGKFVVWLVWLFVAGISLAEIMAHPRTTHVYMSCAVHGVLGAFFLSVLPYAAVMLYRDRRGEYGPEDTTGWKYEDGKWVPTSDSEDENVEDA